MGVLRPWFVLIGTNVILVGFFSYAMFAPQATTRTVMLPGKTTHGHYQIEMKCDACHTNGMTGVKQDVCIDCHGAELKAARDTHPASKFNDPTNADRLQILDAQNCITCHKEHVEERTLDMGLTMPADYCYHCHQETLETRPSHANLAFDSCATAGCHNYHDNRALYENFLLKHGDAEDFVEQAVTLLRESETRGNQKAQDNLPLTISQIDAPEDLSFDETIANDWAATTHAKAAVNCSGCHQVNSDADEPAEENAEATWSNSVALETCASCHESESETFLLGRHGMRLAHDLSPMTPKLARLPMHPLSKHEQLDCMACHDDHLFDTQYAAVDACLKCHNDSHSLAFKDSSHFALLNQELSGELPPGSGVSCATCHMPRLEDDDGQVRVQHNQNDNLRPNEKMIRDVCMNCHGLAFSIDSLADSNLKATCYSGSPSNHIESVDLAKAWFEKKEQERRARQKKKTSSQ